MAVAWVVKDKFVDKYLSSGTLSLHFKNKQTKGESLYFAFACLSVTCDFNSCVQIDECYDNWHHAVALVTVVDVSFFAKKIYQWTFNSADLYWKVLVIIYRRMLEISLNDIEKVDIYSYKLPYHSPFIQVPAYNFIVYQR